MKSVRSTSDERARQVLEVQSAWLQAQATHDYGALDAMAAEEFTAVQSDGTICGRDRALGDYLLSSSSPPQLDELDVRLYGTVAVVFCRVRHAAVARSHRHVNVFVHRSQRWQLVTEVVKECTESNW